MKTSAPWATLLTLFPLMLALLGCAPTQTRAADAKPVTAPKNVILFLGDGMGISTVTAARIFAGQRAGTPGEEHVLTFERFPNVALVKTYNTDAQVPDSAGTMTALVTGHKTRFGVLSVAPTVARGDCAAARKQALPTLLEQSEAAGLRTGIVSTARITHATPAATYAHSADRDWEDDAALPQEAAAQGCIDIASQMLSLPEGDGIDVMLGGGRSNFFPEGELDPEHGKALGRRLDGQNLVANWLRAEPDRRYVWNRSGLLETIPELIPGRSQLLGLFEPSHMQWEADRDTHAEPSLAALTGSAIDFLAADNPKGYFLMVEAGRIDHAHHMGNAYRALVDTLALDAAVAAAISRVDLSETLVLVTADHSHTLTISGYPARGNPILGNVALANGQPLPDANGDAYPTLGYANGPGASAKRADEPSVDPQHPDFRQPAAIPLAVETHAGEDVAAYAAGVNATAVRGVMEQNRLYEVMRTALFGAQVE